MKTLNFAFTILSEYKLTKSRTMETTDKVIKALKDAGKPMKAGEIADASGIEKKDVEKAIKKLVADSKLHSPMRCFYDIKK